MQNKKLAAEKVVFTIFYNELKKSVSDEKLLSLHGKESLISSHPMVLPMTEKKEKVIEMGRSILEVMNNAARNSLNQVYLFGQMLEDVFNWCRANKG